MRQVNDADRSDTSEYAQKAGEVSGTSNVFPSSGSVGIGTTSPETNLQVLGNWRLGPSALGTPPDGVDNWLNANNGILYEGGGADWSHHFSTYGAGDIARFGTSTGAGLAPDTRVVITNSGSVGIGTTTPEAKLHIASPDINGIMLTDSISGTVRATLLNWETVGGQLSLKDVGGGTQAVIRGYEVDSVQAFFTAGNVGIGTVSPATKLEVLGNIKPDYVARIENQNVSGGGLAVHVAGTSTSGNALEVTLGSTTGLVVDGQGKVGIGTPTPSVALEVVGIAMADTLQLATAATRYYSIPNSAFVPYDESLNYTRSWGYLYAYIGNGRFYAPITLPHGAVIKELRVTLFDNNDTTEVMVELDRMLFSSGEPYNEGAASSSGTSPSVRYASQTYNLTVDNENNAYMLYANLGNSTNSSMRLYGARIKYEITSPLP